MGIEIRIDGFGKGIEELTLRLLLKASKIQNGAKIIVRRVTSELKNESKKRAPLDEGDLEKAHAVHLEGKGIETKGTVFIRETDPVKFYAVAMHEDFYNLGSLSRQKQSNQSETVGRKYLERAFNDNKAKWAAYIEKELRRLLSS